MPNLDPASALTQLEVIAVQSAADEIYSAVRALNQACRSAADIGLSVEFSQTTVQHVQDQFPAVIYEAAVSRPVPRTITRPVPGSSWQMQVLHAGTVYEYISPSKGAQQCQS